MSTTTANLGLFKYNTTTDANVAFNIQTALNDNWDKIDTAMSGGGLPDQTDKAGYILTTNGSEASWGETSEVHCIIETFQEGTSWYRIYSDGWCEQGGYFDGNGATINLYTMALLKNYTNTKYSIFTEIYNEDYTGSVGPYYFGVHNKTTSSFQFYSDGNIQRRFWRTCGYIEVD